MLDERQPGVFRAARREPTRRRKEGREEALIGAERCDRQPRENAHDRGPGTAASA